MNYVSNLDFKQSEPGTNTVGIGRLVPPVTALACATLDLHAPDPDLTMTGQNDNSQLVSPQFT